MSGLHLKGRHRPVPKVSSWPLRAYDITTEVRRNHLLGTSVASTDAESSPSRAPWQHGGDLLPVAAASSSFQVATSTRTQKSRIPFLEPQKKTKFQTEKKNEPPLKKNPLLSLAGLSSRSLLVVLLGNRWSHLPQVLRQRLLVLLVILRAKARGSLGFWGWGGGVTREVLYSKHSVEGSIKGT